MNVFPNLPEPIEGGDGDNIGRKRVKGYNTLENLKARKSGTLKYHFCVLCEIGPTHRDDQGGLPIQRLNAVVAAAVKQNKLSPTGFIEYIHAFYKLRIQHLLKDTKSWHVLEPKGGDYPIWRLTTIYEHFTEHQPLRWLCTRERLLMLRPWIQDLADNALFEDAPPDLHVMQMFDKLVQREQALFTSLEPVATAGPAHTSTLNVRKRKHP